MICSVCKHEWCWICGFTDFNGEGTKPDGFNFHFIIVFQCNLFGMLTMLPWYWAIIMGIIVFATLPITICLFTFGVSLGLFYDIILRVPYKQNKLTRLLLTRNHKSKATIIFVLIPLWLILILAFALFSILLTVTIIIPFYILSVLVFIRMIWWWN